VVPWSSAPGKGKGRDARGRKNQLGESQTTTKEGNKGREKREKRDRAEGPVTHEAKEGKGAGKW